MPTNKPMKNQWIEVDGRLIPATLPQHWNGNDWAITGTDNPLPVANYTKKGNLWLPTSEDNPVPTQVTGSNVEDLVVAREIRDASVISHLAAPDGAIGFRAELSVYGSTGIFEEGEGLRLLYWDRTEKRGAFVNTYSTKPTTGSENREQHVIIIHPSVINNDEEDNLLLSNMVIGKAVRLQIDITGEFEEGEGFDCELTVRWLF